LSNRLAIYWFLRCQFDRDGNRWFSVKELSGVIGLSIDRTRKHLSLLAINQDIETKIDGWKNVYRYKTLASVTYITN